MEIISKSIKDFLSDVLKKDINNVGYQDLLSIESITIDGNDEDGNKQEVDFREIKLLKNLKYLEIRNIVVCNYMIRILEGMDYIQNIIFRNCTFRNTISNMDGLNNLNQLRIDNCRNFKLEYINNISIKNLILSNIVISDLSSFKNDSVKYLDISCASVKNGLNIKCNLEKIVVSHNYYIKNKKKLDGSNYQVVVMADAADGFYIEIN